MNTRSLLLFATAAGALAVPLLFTVTTSAGDPVPEPLDGGVDADTDADAAPPPLPSYRLEPFSEERSTEPGAREWASAPPVALDRANIGLFAAASEPGTVRSCEARRVREWMRIRCTFTTGAIALLGGDREGLTMRLDPFKQEEWPTFPEGAQVVFAVRRGDRRVIEWLGVEFGYRGMNSVSPAFVLSEQWAPGDEGPLIVAQ